MNRSVIFPEVSCHFQGGCLWCASEDSEHVGGLGKRNMSAWGSLGRVRGATQRKNGVPTIPFGLVICLRNLSNFFCVKCRSPASIRSKRSKAIATNCTACHRICPKYNTCRNLTISISFFFQSFFFIKKGLIYIFSFLVLTRMLFINIFEVLVYKLV